MFKGKAAFYVLTFIPSHGAVSLPCAPLSPGTRHVFKEYTNKREECFHRVGVMTGEGERGGEEMIRLFIYF